jgi:predicted flap endonuclease-1-like 5' DNA nuclease
MIAAPRDDLKRIKGVGPAIEKILNDLGIFRYRQIAEISDRDVDRVADRLRGFRSRIYREDWIGQARVLQFEANQPPV